MYRIKNIFSTKKCNLVVVGISILVTLIILAVASLKTNAASSTFNSKGQIVYDNGTKDKSDDVIIYDAEDFQRLYDYVLSDYTP